MFKQTEQELLLFYLTWESFKYLFELVMKKENYSLFMNIYLSKLFPQLFFITFTRLHTVAIVWVVSCGLKFEKLTPIESNIFWNNLVKWAIQLGIRFKWSLCCSTFFRSLILYYFLWSLLWILSFLYIERRKAQIITCHKLNEWNTKIYNGGIDKKKFIVSFLFPFHHHYHRHHEEATTCPTHWQRNLFFRCTFQQCKILNCSIFHSLFITTF